MSKSGSKTENFLDERDTNFVIINVRILPRGEPRLELDINRLWNYVELFWNSLKNAPSSIVFYLETNVEVEVGVLDTRSRFIPRFLLYSGPLWPGAPRGLESVAFCQICHTFVTPLAELCFRFNLSRDL